MPEPDAVRPYARALYEAAASHNAAEGIAHDLALIRDLWQADRELLPAFLVHPLVHPAAKEEILARALGTTVHPLTLNLLRILVRRGKASLIPELAAAFFREQEEEGKALHVVVRTARPFSAEERASLARRLAEVLGKPVTIEAAVAPDLMAGIELSVSGRRLDASVRGRLAELAARLRG